jgi:hypothetical protein
MADRLLPAEFSDLERYAARWALPTERQRYAQRLASSLDEMQELYDAVFPRAEEALRYCDQFRLDDMPEPALRLLWLLYSLVQASFPVEVWRQAHVPDSGAAYLDLVTEPVP